VRDIDVEGGEIEGLKSLKIKGFQTFSFSQGCFAGCGNVREPSFLLISGTYQLP